MPVGILKISPFSNTPHRHRPSVPRKSANGPTAQKIPQRFYGCADCFDTLGLAGRAYIVPMCHADVDMLVSTFETPPPMIVKFSFWSLPGVWASMKAVRAWHQITIANDAGFHFLGVIALLLLIQLPRQFVSKRLFRRTRCIHGASPTDQIQRADPKT